MQDRDHDWVKGRESVAIKLSFNRNTFQFPINPANLKISQPSPANKPSIASIGQISIPATRGLKTVSIESFFWDAELLWSNRWCAMRAIDMLDHLDHWQRDKIPMRFTAESLGYDFWVLCENLEYDRRAGEEDDIYFKLDLVEFRPYGAKIIEIDKGGSDWRELYRLNKGIVGNGQDRAIEPGCELIVPDSWRGK